MHISSAHKQRLASIARVATAGAMVVSSLSIAIASPVSAQPLTANSTTLTNSRVSGTGGDYTISFKNVATTAIAEVQVEVCTTADTFGTACTGPTGFAIAGGSLSTSEAKGFGNNAGTSAGTFTSAANNQLKFVPTVPATEGSAMAHTLKIVNAITNASTPGTYYVRVKTFSDNVGTGIDEGTSAFAIVQSVIASGRVLEQMKFEVNGVTTATQCGSGNDTSNIATTPSTVPFGNFQSGTPKVGCHTVSTSTNAVSGFTTTVQRFVAGSSPVGGMCRQTAANCTNDGGSVGVNASDTIVDAVLNATPAAWTPGTTFGVGVNAVGAETATLGFGALNYRSLFDTSPIPVAYNAGPSAGVLTYVTYKADVPVTQTAGVYQNRLMYVSTPIF